MEPHTALFVASTGVGKTHLALDSLERECLSYFDFVIILCPTLRHNKTYRQWKWFWTDPYVILIEPGDSPGSCLYDWMEKLGNILAGCQTLFLIDGIIANKILDKRRQPLLGLAILGRHKGHSLWLLSQSYTTVPMNIRRQVKMLSVWYLKKRRTMSSECQRK